MATLISQISAIRLKVNDLIGDNENLKKKIHLQQSELEEMQNQNRLLQTSLKETEEKIVALKTANALLGSDDYKTKTKLKINALVKEIDQCIAQLT